MRYAKYTNTCYISVANMESTETLQSKLGCTSTFCTALNAMGIELRVEFVVAIELLIYFRRQAVEGAGDTTGT